MIKGGRACFECLKICPRSALKVNRNVLCVKLEGETPIKVEEEKCNKCELCNEICPMGSVILSSESCSFCIICKGEPSCIVYKESRASLLSFFLSLIHFCFSLPRLIFR